MNLLKLIVILPALTISLSANAIDCTVSVAKLDERCSDGESIGVLDLAIHSSYTQSVGSSNPIVFSIRGQEPREIVTGDSNGRIRIISEVLTEVEAGESIQVSVSQGSETASCNAAVVATKCVVGRRYVPVLESVRGESLTFIDAE